jgi:hypothetical protein
MGGIPGYYRHAGTADKVINRFFREGLAQNAQLPVGVKKVRYRHGKGVFYLPLAGPGE